MVRSYVVTRRKPVAVFAIGCSLLLALGVVAFAQDTGPVSSKQLWDQAEGLRNSGDTGNAFKVYSEILDQFPNDNIWTPMSLYRMAMIKYDARDITSALGYTMKLAKDYPASNACKMGYAAFYLTAIYLCFQNNPQAVVDLVKSQIDNYAPNLNSPAWSSSLVRVAQAYVKLGQPKQATDFLDARLPQCLMLLSDSDYYDALVQIALSQKDNQAALTAAREGYALCDFDDTKIKQMANLVRRAYMATGDFSKGLQFLACQDNPQAPNPLKSVPAPKVSQQQEAALLKAAGPKLDQQSLVYLYCSDYGKALDRATQFVATAQDKDAVRSIMVVARVFKAADLDTQRANEFMNFARTGKGVNPCANPGFKADNTGNAAAGGTKRTVANGGKG